jgi:hypothetical protein
MSETYIKVIFNCDTYEESLLESLVVLPGVISAVPMYEDDPALYNVTLVISTPEDANTVLEQATNFEFVEFAEIIEAPEIRGKA